MTGVGFLIARSISRPLQDLQKGLQAFCCNRGFLPFVLAQDSKDEVGSSSVRLMKLWQLHSVRLTSIADGNNMANDASTKMMNAAKVMAANAETQSSSVEETESQVNSNAASARK